MKLRCSSFLSIFFLPISITPVFAQINIDGSTNTTLTPTDNGVRIDDGDRAGGNLFHSFREFSVGTGSEAFFNNASDIVNIFSRVTGGTISNIDGLIRANGGANLFLINPAGILFGNNASLQIGGSFYGSTANSILFPNGVEFSATNTQRPLLTINAPIGLNLRDNPAPIVNRSFVLNSAGDDFVGLEVAPGNTLSLVGGDIDFQGGEATANGGRIELGGLRNAGTVTLNDDGSLSFPEDVARADITFSNAADIDVRGTNGGSITINGRNVSLSAGDFGSSVIRAGITANSTSPEAQAGDITINATDNVTIDQSFIVNDVNPNAVGIAGDVSIDTTNLNLTNGGFISSSTFALGNAGTVTITAGELISVENGAIATEVGQDAVGNAGGVSIETTNLSLTNGGFISSSTFALGNAGTVTINAGELISVDDSLIASQVNSDAVGNAGGVSIETTNLSLTNGGFISSSTFALGNAGTVTINAGELISVDGNLSSIASQVGQDAVGIAGGVSIETTDLSLTNGGQISSGTFALGNGGTVTITAENTISVDGNFSAIASQVDPDAVGNAGDVSIETTDLTLTNGGQISNSTFGEGNAGTVSITAAELISLDDSVIGSSVQPDAVGNAGGVSIETTDLSLTNGGQITSSTFGEGNAGTVSITAAELISLDGEDMDGFSSAIASDVQPGAVGNAGFVNINTNDFSLTNGAFVSSSNFNQGESGNVNINANSVRLENGIIGASTNSGIERGNIFLEIAETLTLQQDSLISAEATGEAIGGNIDINAEFIIAFPSNSDGNDIVASAERGDGGNINITAEALLGIEERPATPGNGTNDVDASSEFGLDGNITFNVPDTNNFQETAELSSNVVSAESVAQDACAAGAGTSGLVLKGKGGVPPAPNLPLTAEALLGDGKPITPNFSQSNNQQISTQNIPPQIQPIKTSQGDIYPARGIIVREDGTVILTPYPTDNVASRTPADTTNCHQIQ